MTWWTKPAMLFPPTALKFCFCLSPSPVSLFLPGRQETASILLNPQDRRDSLAHRRSPVNTCGIEVHDKWLDNQSQCPNEWAIWLLLCRGWEGNGITMCLWIRTMQKDETILQYWSFISFSQLGCSCLQTKYFLSEETPVYFLLRLSTDWIRPNYTMEGHLLYARSTEVNVSFI